MPGRHADAMVRARAQAKAPLRDMARRLKRFEGVEAAALELSAEEATSVLARRASKLCMRVPRVTPSAVGAERLVTLLYHREYRLNRALSILSSCF